jgi:hypothetical protein
MATGYTHPVRDGSCTDFTEFALSCARAMGAFIHQRDDDMRTKPRLPDPPDISRHEREVEEAVERLERARALSTEEIIAIIEREHADACAMRAEYRQTQETERQRYEAMIAKVEAWRIPARLESFRAFMLEQLRDSVKFDCDGDFYKDDPEKPSVTEWRSREIAHAMRERAYHEERIEAEKTWYADRVAYTTDLYESLGLPVPEPAAVG